MTDKNDLKPGDFARHPKHPELIGTVSCDYSGVLWVNYVGSNGFRLADRDLTDWERVEVVQPGHVQIKVDDLELPADEPERARISVDDLKPTSTTVTLPCPDCGEAITRTAEVWTGIPRNRILAWATTEWHTCPPEQPDEPTEFGARVTVTMADGSAEKWCRLGQHSPTPWLGEGYSVPGEGWDLLCRRGTVTIGWSVEDD